MTLLTLAIIKDAGKFLLRKFNEIIIEEKTKLGDGSNGVVYRVFAIPKDDNFTEEERKTTKYGAFKEFKEETILRLQFMWEAFCLW